ncbi:hypothetical protein THASP1DRAFT_32867 [Thamnocephalis sphaerospora]|uniref:Uncharacterized protein n=1 Tax=Thamnocephalis sphaerospora TaxID=78915 RepID=A0A4P9XI29_9FUNG|nr:hypothetical protein THASP1DRAFT_32867 [Thamnocephalis sphaerospora]|eukprot:RKP05297.1 hypothetical protein THASP1DRAFT_32867 [Thamnocephalis sphaerospora]
MPCATHAGSHMKAKLGHYAQTLSMASTNDNSNADHAPQVAAITVVENLHKYVRMHRQSVKEALKGEERTRCTSVVATQEADAFATLRAGLGGSTARGHILYRLESDRLNSGLSPDALHHSKRIKKQQDYLALLWELDNTESRFFTAELICADQQWLLDDPVGHHVFRLLMQLGRTECGEMLYRTTTLPSDSDAKGANTLAVAAHMSIGLSPTISVNVASSLDSTAQAIQKSMPYEPLPTMRITLENMHPTLLLDQRQSFLVACTMEAGGAMLSDSEMTCGETCTLQLTPNAERQLGAVVLRLRDTKLLMQTPHLVLAWRQAALPCSDLFFHADILRQDDTGKPIVTAALADIHAQVYENGRGVYAQQLASVLSNGTHYALTVTVAPPSHDGVLDVRVCLTMDLEHVQAAPSIGKQVLVDTETDRFACVQNLHPSLSLHRPHVYHTDRDLVDFWNHDIIPGQMGMVRLEGAISADQPNEPRTGFMLAQLARTWPAPIKEKLYLVAGWEVCDTNHLFYADILSFVGAPFEPLRSKTAQMNFYRRCIQPHLTESGSNTVRQHSIESCDIGLAVMAITSPCSPRRLDIVLRQRLSGPEQMFTAPWQLAAQRTQAHSARKFPGHTTSMGARSLISPNSPTYMFDQEPTSPTDGPALPYTTVLDGSLTVSENNGTLQEIEPLWMSLQDWEIGVVAPVNSDNAMVTPLAEPEPPSTPEPLESQPASTGLMTLDELTFTDDAWAKSLVDFSISLNIS